MLENGNLVKKMEKEYIHMKMEMYMKVDGKMIGFMDKGYINIVMEVNTMANGKMDIIMV